MGKRGPKPTPTKLLLLRGNPGKRPVNDREPKPEPVTEVPPAPAWLREHGRREWDRVAPILVNTGVLTKADIGPFEVYCTAYQDALELGEDLEKNGRTYHTETKHERARPQVSDQHAAWHAVKAFAVEFGLTPSSRSRVVAAPAAKGDDDESFLFGTR